MKDRPNSFVLVIIFLTFLTSSFDIFLNFKILGFSLRFVFITILILIITYLFHLGHQQKKERIKIIGLKFLCLWLLLLILFIPHTTILVRNIAYVVWLCFYLVFIPILPFFFKSINYFYLLIRLYFLSFCILAVCGIIQFILGCFDINILIMQIWENGLPRSSAFSYEPSYYSTYLLLGWVTAFFLTVKKCSVNRYFKTKPTLILTTISIVLSGSRMGILFLIVLVGIYILSGIKDVFLYQRIKKQVIPFFFIFTFSISSAVIYFAYNIDQLKVYARGLGLLGTVAHSYVVRTSDFESTVIAFLKSPIIGYSLGGIPSAIAEIRGVTISTQQEAKAFEGLNIFAEVLAASGIFGFMFFIFFLFTFFRRLMKVSKIINPINPEISKVINALVLSLFIELAILALNQNILRAYLWIHIAILNLAFFVAMTYVRSYHSQLLLKADQPH